MRYAVVSFLMLVGLVNQVAVQSPPPSPPPSSSSSPTQPNPTAGPTSTPPVDGTSTPPPSGSGSGSPPGGPASGNSGGTGGTPPSGGGAGTDNLPCIKNFLALCEAYQFQFNKVSEEYGCTRFTNPYLFSFHTNLVESSMECDTVMQLEVIRQNVMTSKGQPAPSTHAF